MMTSTNVPVKAVLPYRRDIMLRDGAVLRMRALTADDRDGLLALFNRCSPETIRYRFLRIITSLPDSLLDQLVGVDSSRHVALVVVHGEGADEKIVGVGRYIASHDQPEVAEVSFLIEDAWQKRGIGTILLDALAETAREHGVKRFAADVLADNRLMLSVFRKAGYGVNSNISYGVTHLEFGIARSERAELRREAQEMEAERASLSAVFAPRSVAIVGASRDAASVGGALFRNLLRWEFSGVVYPVNPNATAVAGVRAYPGISDLPEVPELAILTIPANKVLESARRCAAAGVRALCVISAGFAETGPDGARLQTELLDVCRASGMRLVGPNCMGIVNTSSGVRMLGTFAPVEPPAGNIAMSSQSGALGLALMAQAGQLGLGVSSFISVGNKADVSGNDLLQYWESDDSTDVILLYLESFGNPRRFTRIARRVARAKPIVAVKAGRTVAGARAASSHTAALANSDRFADALFAQTGIIRVDTLADFFAVARLLASQPIPKGGNLAILTNAGGPAILAVDAAEATGLTIPELSAGTKDKLRSALPASASVANPVDMIAGACPQHYRACLEILCDDPDIDAILIIFIPPLLTPSSEVAETIGEVLRARPDLTKTIAAVFLDPHSPISSIPAGRKAVPVYAFPEGAVAALGAAVHYGTWRATPPGNPVEIDVNLETVNEVIAAHPEEGWLPQDSVEKLLGSTGIKLLRTAVARSSEEALTAAQSIARNSETKVAMKIAAPAVLHKSDVGGVLLNIAPSEADAAFKRLAAQLTAHDIHLEAVTISEMAQPGVEALAGITHDPVFGPLLAFGAGGYLVELVDDVIFRVLPVNDRDVSEMIASTRVARQLEGYRGSPPADTPALEDLLHRLGALAETAPRIAEVDLNPVIVHRAGEGLSLIDARIRLRAS
ncbi:MAG: GNAT family N-acetyltransferase [Blastocatellales bacterium]|nr:GNAT family N-acetyltransferase [Blastocatellales bacterium]